MECNTTAYTSFGFTQGLDLANTVAEAQTMIDRHRRDNAALGLTVIDLGVINAEHFPFNVTGYGPSGMFRLALQSHIR